MQFWVQRESAQAWINEHPSIKAWLARHMKTSTQDKYGHAFYVFCRAVGKSPEELLEMRKAGNGNGWNLEKMLQDFLISGTYASMGRHDKGRVVEMRALSLPVRKGYYTSVRDFFAQTYGDNGPLTLPQDKAFKIQTDESRENTRPTYIHLPDAQRIIGTMKEPYHTLFTIALYSGMGRDELLCLNKFWPSLRRQLNEGKDPIRMDFSRRKKGDQPYFTLIPASLLKPYADIEANPFKSHDIKNGGMKPIAYYDLRTAWIGALKRAKIDIRYTAHELRDLFITRIVHKADALESVSHFLVGHTDPLDKNRYLQYMQEPEIVLEEWTKIRKYIDSGMQEKMSQLEKKYESLAEARIRELEHEILQEEGGIVEENTDEQNAERRKEIAWMRVEVDRLKAELLKQ
jgi:integrase